MNNGMRFVPLYRRPFYGSRPFPRKEMQKSKMAVWGGLQIAVKEEKQKAKEKRKDMSI